MRKLVQGVCLFSLLLVTQAYAQEYSILTVDQCIDNALKNNAVLKVSGEHVKQSQFRKQAATAMLLPTVSSDLYGAVSTDVPVVAIEGMIEQPLFLGGILAEKRKAETGTRISQKEEILSQADLAYVIRQTYYETKKSEVGIKLLQEEVTYSKKIVAADKRLIEAEYRTQATMLEHAALLGNKEKELVEKEKRLEFLYDYLVALTGLDKNKSYVLEDASETGKDGAISEKPNEPFLSLLELKIAEAEEDLKIAKSGMWPKVNLVGKYRREKDSYYDKNAFEAGVLVHWNIWDFGQTIAHINEKKSQLEERKLLKESELQMQVIQLKKAMDDLAIKRQSIAIKKQVLEATEEKAKNLKIRRIKGDISVLDMADMELRLLKAKTELVEETCDYRIAEAGVLKTMGVVR